MQLRHPAVLVRVDDRDLAVLARGHLVQLELDDLHRVLDRGDLAGVLDVEDAQHLVVAAVEQDDHVVAERDLVLVHDVDAHARVLGRGKVLTLVG